MTVFTNVNDGASALLINLPQAITDYLNLGSFSLAFTAVRRAVPIFELTDMSTLRVSVVPRLLDIEVLTRSEESYDAQVDIAIQQRLDDLTNASVDPYLNLTEEIGDYLKRIVLTSGSSRYLWKKIENAPIYSPDHAKELNQFTSVLRSTYREVR